jgi:cytochrome P450 family 710 subfamily A protein
VLLFLFASQDASTASLVWTTALMADRPDVLARVRQEQYALRPDLEATIDGEALSKMDYTRQVVKEILRYRAPAPMVPQVRRRRRRRRRPRRHRGGSPCWLRRMLCVQAAVLATPTHLLCLPPRNGGRAQMTYGKYALSEDYTIPSGTLVFPSINSGCMQGFTDPEAFDPDRFSPERKEDIVHAKNYLVFGAGAHYCVGKEYAINQLVAFLAIMSTSADWDRRRTERSDEWQYLPTIYPYDSLITLRARTATGPDPK